jgi:hypothetical protein
MGKELLCSVLLWLLTRHQHSKYGPIQHGMQEKKRTDYDCFPLSPDALFN